MEEPSNCRASEQHEARARSGFEECRDWKGRVERRGPYSANDSNAKTPVKVLPFRRPVARRLFVERQFAMAA